MQQYFFAASLVAKPNNQMKTLTRIRTQTGLSQRQLAAFIGKEHTQLHRFETGERMPPADAMQKITLLLQAASQQEESSEPAIMNDAQRKEWQAHAFGSRVQAKNRQAIATHGEKGRTMRNAATSAGRIGKTGGIGYAAEALDSRTTLPG
jgi:transcriptional regulator with XRE-family HTH domain